MRWNPRADPRNRQFPFHPPALYMPDRLFITGTDTGVGKTMVSALLCASLDAIYWKPIQTGTSEGTDTETVMHLESLPRERTWPESYHFLPPVSPHLAASRAGTRIDLRKIQMPRIAPRENLIAEGAGGVLVPINRTQLMTHLMRRIKLPVLLVSRTSLGTINHTLLSIAALRAARLDLRGVIMVGHRNTENQKAIEHYGDVQVIGTVPWLEKIDRAILRKVFRRHFDRRVFGQKHPLGAHEFGFAYLASLYARGARSAADSHHQGRGRLSLHRR